MEDLTECMRQWRTGCLSDSEIIGYLLQALDEVRTVIRGDEDNEAARRMQRLGIE